MPPVSAYFGAGFYLQKQPQLEIILYQGTFCYWDIQARLASE